MFFIIDFFMDYDEAGVVPGQRKDLLSKNNEKDGLLGMTDNI